ncbi:MAG: hypothetical protein LBU80_01335 [Rikenellaceae bacterium]|jgi:hypothetical protein|nr:hypothetical protein [Rikenellaceae bacterium]
MKKRKIFRIVYLVINVCYIILTVLFFLLNETKLSAFIASLILGTLLTVNAVLQLRQPHKDEKQEEN